MMQIIGRIAKAATVLAATALVGGCGDSEFPDATGKGSIRGINSIVEAPEVAFLIEERALGTIGFKQTTGFDEWDDLNYTFNFDVFPFTALAPIRLASQFLDVIVDTEYTMVLTGTFDNPSIILWEDVEREWQETETVFEVSFMHLSPQLGEVDVYFDLTGTLPVLGNEIGTLTNGERLPLQELANGQYELVITAPDDPLTVLFQSQAITSAPATRVTFAIFDPDRTITADVAVNLINSGGGSVSLADVSAAPQIRLLHTAFGTENVDGFYDSDFGATIFPDIEFGELSAYADLAAGSASLTLTSVGDTTSVVFDSGIVVAPNSKSTVILAGAPGSLSYRTLPDDARPQSLFPVVRTTNMSVNTDVLDVYFLEPGTPVDDDAFPRFLFMPSLNDTGFVAFSSGMYEITLTIAGEKTVVSATLPIDIAVGDVVDIVILDTADPAVVELRIFDST